jgi:hypothetical protein
MSTVDCDAASDVTVSTPKSTAPTSAAPSPVHVRPATADELAALRRSDDPTPDEAIAEARRGLKLLRREHGDSVGFTLFQGIHGGTTTTVLVIDSREPSSILGSVAEAFAVPPPFAFRVFVADLHYADAVACVQFRLKGFSG